MASGCARCGDSFKAKILKCGLMPKNANAEQYDLLRTMQLDLCGYHRLHPVDGTAPTRAKCFRKKQTPPAPIGQSRAMTDRPRPEATTSIRRKTNRYPADEQKLPPAGLHTLTERLAASGPNRLLPNAASFSGSRHQNFQVGARGNSGAAEEKTNGAVASIDAAEPAR